MRMEKPPQLSGSHGSKPFILFLDAGLDFSAGIQSIQTQLSFGQRFPNIHPLIQNIVDAVAQILPGHPALNSHFLGDVMRTFCVINLGIAVDTPRGLLVPNVMEAEKMTLPELSKAAKALIAAAQTGKVSMDLMTNGTFTVTNLGSLGIESFTPVINPPQTGILGVCTTVNRFDNEGKPYPAMGLSLTFDHRALDGAPAARFLKELCAYLERWAVELE